MSAPNDERRSALGVFLLVFTPLVLAGVAVVLYVAGTKNAPQQAPAAVSRPADPVPAADTIVRGEGMLRERQTFTFVPGATSGGSVEFTGSHFFGGRIHSLGHVELESVRNVPKFWRLWDFLELFGIERYDHWALVRQGHSYVFWFGRPVQACAVVQVTAFDGDPYSKKPSVAFRYKLQTSGTNRF